MGFQVGCSAGDRSIRRLVSPGTFVLDVGTVWKSCAAGLLRVALICSVCPQGMIKSVHKRTENRQQGRWNREKEKEEEEEEEEQSSPGVLLPAISKIASMVLWETCPLLLSSLICSSSPHSPCVFRPWDFYRQDELRRRAFAR